MVFLFFRSRSLSASDSDSGTQVTECRLMKN
jgi:hypothetical protein